MLKKIIRCAAIFLISICSAFSQIEEGQPLDKILAVVGNEVITLSDMNTQLYILMQTDPKLDFNDAALRTKVLNAMINEKLVVIKAIEDSVAVSDDEIKSRWEYQLDRLIEYYGSEKRIEDIYGMSITRIQYEYRDEIRKQLLAERLKSQKFSSIKVSPSEIEEFFNIYKDSIPELPQQVEIYHIVKNIEASKTEKEDLKNFAKSVRDSLLNGADFGVLARRYSGDPGSASSGGELGWFGKGKLFPEFEQAAFSLQPGEISPPVETPFGFHIIQTLQKNKDSVFTRHILFKSGISDTTKDKVMKLLGEIKQRVEKGESFEDLAKKYSDEKETKGFGGFIGKFPTDKLEESLKSLPNFSKVLKELSEGGISDPQVYMTQPGLSYHIIYKKRIIPPHAPNLTDDAKEMEKLAIAYKQNKMYSEWIESLRKELYWEVK